MPNYNHIIVMGHLGKDPELRYTPDGMAICSFTMAVNDRKKVEGQYQDMPLWFKVTAWRKTAENASQYLSKGQPCLVAGRLTMDEWTTNDGKQVSQLAILASEIRFLSIGNKDPMQQARPRSEPVTNRPRAATAPVSPPPQDISDDDIPF
jgi:single-strand DNA-binding protein